LCQQILSHVSCIAPHNFFSDVFSSKNNSLREKLLKKERKILLTLRKEFILLLGLFLSNSFQILQRELETVAKKLMVIGSKYNFSGIINKFSCKEEEKYTQRQETGDLPQNCQ